MRKQPRGGGTTIIIVSRVLTTYREKFIQMRGHQKWPHILDNHYDSSRVGGNVQVNSIWQLEEFPGNL